MEKDGKIWNGKIYGNEKNDIFAIKNGKGYIKEYDIEDYSKLIFEGEYLNGERKKGKEYDIEGNLIFEGEYLNGEIWNGKAFFALIMIF